MLALAFDTPLQIALGVSLLVALLIFWTVALVFGRNWIMAMAAGVPIPFVRIVGMYLRRTDVKSIVIAMILVRKAGVNVSLDLMEVHQLAGGDVQSMAKALIQTQTAGLEPDAQALSSLLLNGRETRPVIEALHTARTAGLAIPFATVVAASCADIDVKEAVADLIERNDRGEDVTPVIEEWKTLTNDSQENGG